MRAEIGEGREEREAFRAETADLQAQLEDCLEHRKKCDDSAEGGDGGRKAGASSARRPRLHSSSRTPPRRPSARDGNAQSEDELAQSSTPPQPHGRGSRSPSFDSTYDGTPGREHGAPAGPSAKKASTPPSRTSPRRAGTTQIVDDSDSGDSSSLNSPPSHLSSPADDGTSGESPKQPSTIAKQAESQRAGSKRSSSEASRDEDEDTAPTPPKRVRKNATKAASKAAPKAEAKAATKPPGKLHRLPAVQRSWLETEGSSAT